MKVVHVSASLLLTSCSLKLPESRLHQKGYSFFSLLFITFMFFFFSFAWSLSIELSFFLCMAESSRHNPVEQLLPCCTAPTTIQIGSGLEGICMLWKWYSPLHSLFVCCEIGATVWCQYYKRPIGCHYEYHKQTVDTIKAWFFINNINILHFSILRTAVFLPNYLKYDYDYMIMILLLLLVCQIFDVLLFCIWHHQWQKTCLDIESMSVWCNICIILNHLPHIIIV